MVGKLRRAFSQYKYRYNLKSFKIGKRRQDKIIRSLLRTYDVEYAPMHYQGVDIKAWKIGRDFKGEPDIVMEITNYSRTSYMNYSRAMRYIENLNQYPNSRKVLVASFRENIKALIPLLRQYKIEIKIMGRQD
jgi:hypothetical protein